jgi:GDP-L-fucose synthase
MKILITGGNGYIAKSLFASLSQKYDVTSISRSDFDLSISSDTKEWFSDKYFDVVIHTAIKGGSRLVSDTSDVLDTNLKMYYNLLDNRSHFDKLINFGSGAELYLKDTFYGLSKHIIRQSILGINGFYNLRIFGVFDENELETRFIKGNILRYLRKEPIQIYEDKRMTFFHMSDLVELVTSYINGDLTDKEVECAYDANHSLLDISDMINTLSDYKVPIVVQSDIMGTYYIGWNSSIGDKLSERIVEVYNKLKV